MRGPLVASSSVSPPTEPSCVAEEIVHVGAVASLVATARNSSLTPDSPMARIEVDGVTRMSHAMVAVEPTTSTDTACAPFWASNEAIVAPPRPEPERNWTTVVWPVGSTVRFWTAELMELEPSLEPPEQPARLAASKEASTMPACFPKLMIRGPLLRLAMSFRAPGTIRAAWRRGSSGPPLVRHVAGSATQPSS